MGEQERMLTDRVDAEKYYKSMYSSLFFSRDNSWNLRDTHMFETLDRCPEAPRQ
jgi:erythromycin esterase-like protein